MKCHRFTKKLMAYHDGELSASDRSRVEEHLLACPACRKTLEGLARADAASAPPEPSPAYWANFTSRVMARVPAEAPAREVAFGLIPARRSYLRFVPYASAALVLVAVAGYFLDIRVGLRRHDGTQVASLEKEQAASPASAEDKAACPVPGMTASTVVLADASSAAEALPAWDLLRSNLASGELLLVQVLKIRPNGDVYELSALKSDLLNSGLVDRAQRLREAVTPVGDPELTRLLDDLLASMRALQDSTPQDLPRVQDGIRQSGVLERAADYKAILYGGGERL